MLDLSMGEIGVIAAIALVVLGPDKLPQVAKTAGSLMGKAQRFVAQVKNDIDKEVELSELKKIQEDAKKMANDLQSTLKNTTDSIEKQVGEVRDSVTSAGQEVKSTMDSASKEIKDNWMEATAPKSELSMENIVSSGENSSSSQPQNADSSWQDLAKKVDTSHLEGAYDWSEDPYTPSVQVPQDLNGPASQAESLGFTETPGRSPLVSDPIAPTIADLMREINALKQQMDAQKKVTTAGGRFAPRSHINKTRISRC